MSLGGGYDPLLAEALKKVYRRGVLVVAAASKIRGRTSYPAALPFVLGVGGIDFRGVPLERVDADVWAPGEDIFTTLPDGDYGFTSGASMAAAVVTSGLAFLKTRYPRSSPRALKRMAEEGADVKAGFKVFNLERILRKSVEKGY